MNNTKGLSVDLRVYEGNDRNTLNLLANRAGFVENEAYIDKTEFTLEAGSAIEIPNAGQTKVFILYSTKEIQITANIGNNLTPIVFDNQTVFVISDKVSLVHLDNTSSSLSNIQVIRLSRANTALGARIPRQLITFSALSRIAQLPQAVVSYNKFKVQNTTLTEWTIEQSIAPTTGATVLNKYRLCDINGTPSVTGTHIMILNDTISQQNFSGTLQLWVEEIY